MMPDSTYAVVTAHTPGPWMVTEFNSGNGANFSITLPDGESVTLGHTSAVRNPLALRGRAPIERDEAVANARLMAAAPELYEALKAAREFITDPDAILGARWAAQVVAKIDAALLKAEGGSNG